MSTTLFKVDGIDLSTIFAPYISGTKASATGYSVINNDLSNIFAPYVSGTKASVTGYSVNNNDLSNIFLKIRSWTTVGTSALVGTGAACNVIYIDSTTGYIYIGGVFTSVGGVTAKNIARWDGTSWSNLATGLNNAVNDIVVNSSGIIYACGIFTDTGTATTGCLSIAYYTPGSPFSSGVWAQLGVGFQSGTVLNTLDIISGKIYIGGAYTTNGNGVVGSFQNICYWGTSGFYVAIPAASTASKNGFDAACLAVKNNTVNGYIYFGGAFTGFYQRSLTTTTCNRVCSYDGTYFNIMSPGPGVNGQVNAITFDPSGNVYFGGSFTTAGSVSVKNVVKWTSSSLNTTTHVETGTWSALGVGLNGAVNSLSFANNTLYAGGSFTTLGDTTTTVNYIASYTGSSWSVISTSLNNSVKTITLDSSGVIYAGGSFTSPYTGLAKYS